MRNKRTASVVLAALIVLVLSGCVRFQAQMTVNPDDTVSGSIIAAAIVGDQADSRDQAQDAADQIEQQLLSALRGAPGVTREVYDEDGYLGSRFTFSNTPISAFQSTGDNGSLSLTRDGEQFVFSGALDFTPDQSDVAPDDGADTSNITVSITFPGTVVESNGEVNGTTVSWSTTYEQSIEMDARASAVASSPPTWVWILSAGVLLLVGIIVVVLLRLRRTGQANATRSAA